MGMRKRRCPVCGKLRRYQEGAVAPADARKPWRVVGHLKVCAFCADRLEGKQTGCHALVREDECEK